MITYLKTTFGVIMIIYIFDNKTIPEIYLSGEVSIAAPNKHFKRKPIDYILYFVKEGSMTITEGDEIYVLNKNDVIILDPSRTHNGIETDYSVRYSYIHFDYSEIAEQDMTKEAIEELMLYNMTESRNQRIILPKKFSVSNAYAIDALELMKSITSEFNDGRNYNIQMARSMLLQLFITLYRGYLDTLCHEESKQNDVLLELEMFLKEHSREKITGEDIEKYFHMNFDYLNRIFKKRFGRTIMQYVNYYRIEDAKKMLRSGLLSVKQIAADLGFVNEFYFSRVFKKYEGVSPSEFITRK